MDAYTIYQNAQRTLETTPGDEIATHIVNSWKACKTLVAEKGVLQAEVESLKQQLAEAQRRAADYARNLDMAETKLETATGGSGARPPINTVRDLIASFED